MPRSPIEPLESRRLLASIVLQDHTLTVHGMADIGSSISVGFAAGGTSIAASVTWTTGRGRHARAHVDAEAFPLDDDISLVRVYGGTRADYIQIDQTYSSFPIMAQLYGEDGRDTIIGGDEPDLIVGGNGNDLLMGGAGSDTLLGQGGNDTLIGGDGGDYLDGRRGRDVEEGGDGPDTIHDPFGPDTILGGAGPTTFQINSLKTDKDNDYNVTKDTVTLIPIPGTVSDNNNGFLGGLLPITSLL